MWVWLEIIHGEIFCAFGNIPQMYYWWHILFFSVTTENILQMVRGVGE